MAELDEVRQTRLGWMVYVGEWHSHPLVVAWIVNWGSLVTPNGLRQPSGRLVADYLAEEAAGLAAIVVARRNEAGAEILIVDLKTGVPQRPVVPIECVERIGITFGGEGSMPLVLMLRDDFPDTEHQQPVPDGCPAAICIDDRPWQEARLTWTPVELLQRVLAWFRRAARGELHDPHQPLDPFFGLSPYRFVFPTSVLSGTEGVELVGFLSDTDEPNVVIVLPLASLPRQVETSRILPVAYRIPPKRMTRMKRAPRDLAGTQFRPRRPRRRSRQGPAHTHYGMVRLGP